MYVRVKEHKTNVAFVPPKEIPAITLDFLPLKLNLPRNRGIERKIVYNAPVHIAYASRERREKSASFPLKVSINLQRYRVPSAINSARAVINSCVRAAAARLGSSCHDRIVVR